MQQLRFYSPQWLYSTCFGWQSHPSSGVHMLYIQHMYSWWWVRYSPETCRVKPLRRIKTQLLHLVGLISLLGSSVTILRSDITTFLWNLTAGWGTPEGLKQFWRLHCDVQFEKKLTWSQLRYKGEAKLSQTLVICLELARFNGPRQSQRPRLGVRRRVGTYLSVTPSSIMLSASLTSSSQSPQDNLFDDAPSRCKLRSGI